MAGAVRRSAGHPALLVLTLAVALAPVSAADDIAKNGGVKVDEDRNGFATAENVSGDWTFNGARLRQGDGLEREGKVEALSTDARLDLHLVGGDVVGLRGSSMTIRSGSEELANVPAWIGAPTGEPGSSATYLDLESGTLIALIQSTASPRKRVIGVATAAFRFEMHGGEALVLDVTDETTTLSVLEGSVTVEEPFPKRGLWQPADVPAGHRVTATGDRIEPQNALSAEERSRLESEVRAIARPSDASR